MVITERVEAGVDERSNSSRQQIFLSGGRDDANRTRIDKTIRIDAVAHMTSISPTDDYVVRTEGLGPAARARPCQSLGFAFARPRETKSILEKPACNAIPPALIRDLYATSGSPASSRSSRSEKNADRLCSASVISSLS